MHVTKPSLMSMTLDVNILHCVVFPLCVFLSHAAGLHRLGCHGGGFFTRIQLVQSLFCNFIVLFMFPPSVYRVRYFCVVLIPFALS